MIFQMIVHPGQEVWRPVRIVWLLFGNIRREFKIPSQLKNYSISAILFRYMIKLRKK